MNYYFDTSALFRHYHQELGSEVVAQLMNESNARHFVSWLTILETHSALSQKVRTGNLTTRKLKTLSKKLKTDIVHHRFFVVRMLRRYYDHAAELIFTYGGKRRLRAADALHLAIAIDLCRETRIDCFVTADANLVAVGRQVGIKIINPLDV